VVAKLLTKTDPVHKVTIIPRGRALGVTMQLPTEDRYSQDRERLLNTITVLFGGRIAEELFMNQMTTGASNDFERATEIARRMVTQWGMSDALGPMVYGENEGEVFLGRSITTHKNVSETTLQKVDARSAALSTSSTSSRAGCSRRTATRSRRWPRRCSSTRRWIPTSWATSWRASRRGRPRFRRQAFRPARRLTARNLPPRLQPASDSRQQIGILRCGGFLLPLDRPLLMGVVNITPDSFSDGGKFLEPKAAIEHGRRLIEEGADILDIGGESSRPGAQAVAEQEELDASFRS
jgi:hypothetical protein